MVTDPAEVFRLGTEKSEENLAFRRFLAAHHHHDDEPFQILASDVQKQVDCTACGNCCRYSVVSVSDGEIARIARHLGHNAEEALHRYTIADPESPLSRTLKSTKDGCIFLKANLCAVYTVRPKACRDFPHVQPGAHTLGSRLSSHARWAPYCAIVYNALEQYKHVTGYFARRHQHA